MGIFSCLPKIHRCCWCARNLKCAAVCIVCWSWFVAVHETAMTYRPSCHDQFEGDGLGKVLRIYKWTLFAVNLIILIAGFGFILGIFIFQKKKYLADIFIVCGIVAAVFSLCYSAMVLVRLFSAKCPFNVNDVVLFLLYSGMWFYFLLVVNTYREAIQQ